MKKALVTGITGQDGSYLARLLLEKGYEVHGMRRRVSVDHTMRLHDIIAHPHFILHYGDVTDAASMIHLIAQVKPDEIYNLAAQSDVAISFTIPSYTAQTDAFGVLNILEAIRILGLENKVKLYQASSSELFGKVQEIPQTEKTPFYPRSPYAVAKLYAYWMVVNYREAYSIFACNGILFNHESPIRGDNFVTKKITQAVANIIRGAQKTLYLGNLEARRDWGYAGDYVEAMWLMLQQEVPEDFVIATGISHSVRTFVETAFAYVDISIVWQGCGLLEQGINAHDGSVVVAVDERYFRPSEVDYLLGNATKARTVLGWQPKTDFKQLIACMMEAELQGLNKKIDDCPLTSLTLHNPDTTGSPSFDWRSGLDGGTETNFYSSPSNPELVEGSGGICPSTGSGLDGKKIKNLESEITL